jgi:predicted transcriptional regulator
MMPETVVTTPITFRLEAKDRDHVDKLANHLGLSRNDCLVEAVRNWLQMRSWEQQQVSLSREETAAGAPTYSQQEVRQRMQALFDRDR